MKHIFVIFISTLFLLLPSFSFASSNADDAVPDSEQASAVENSTDRSDPSGQNDPLSIIETRRSESEKEKEKKKPPEVKKPEGGIIKGTLKDERGNPVPGATITCSDESGAILEKAVTDAIGAYEFKNLESGTYTINAYYSGFVPPLEIKFEKGTVSRPPIPTGIEAVEVDRGYGEGSIIRVSWDAMANSTGYRCELYIRNEREPVMKYPDMEQNFCEFGNLEVKTEYLVRVYSKNNSGYSSSYALALIRTKNRPLSAPYGLGVMSALNNQVNLIFNSSNSSDVAKYVLQIRKGKGPWLYYTKKGLSSNKGDAYVIQSKSGGLIAYIINDILENGAPLIENSRPYSFRVMSVDSAGLLSSPSYPVTDIVLEDTVPPSSPFNITYKFITEDRVRIHWETKDSDIEKFRVYYGVTRDRWDGIAYTSKDYLDLLVNRTALQDRGLYITVTAIDRAGNESRYMPVSESVTALSGGPIEKDIILPSEKIFRDVSQAVRQPPPKKVVRKTQEIKKPTAPPKPKKYDAVYLKEKGYSVDKGETAVLRGSILFPDNAIITVNTGGTLIVEDAQLGPEGSLWGGIRYLSGSSGYIRQSIISGAATGIAVLDNKSGLSFTDIGVNYCKENGIFVKNSSLSIDVANITNNNTGVFVMNGDLKISNADINGNSKGILANNYRLDVQNTIFRYNKNYGIRLYGGGKITDSIFESNLVGIVFEEGNGRGIVTGCTIEKNRIDGIVVSASNADIRSNSISENGRHGIYSRDGANPIVVKNDIISNKKYAVVGGGRVSGCFIAYNNGSIYTDDTLEKGKPDNVLSSSSSTVIKQIVDVDYIQALSYNSVLQ